MAPSHATTHTIHLLEQATGIVMPVYFRPDTDPTFARSLLRETVALFVREVADPAHICLSADGPGPAGEAAHAVAAELGLQVVQAMQNGGKLAALRRGMQHLLQNPELRYLAAVDQDGDHFGNELLNFVRCAEHVAQVQQTDRVLVLGNRLSRHRPLGFLRGEQEELANRMLVDALTYHAARCGRPLVWQFAAVDAPLPDFHSGYKLFSRATAEAVFTAPPNLAGCSETAYYRHACEAVMIVESLQAGAILATVNRRTFDEQPTSVFATMDRSQLAADMIIWPCKRLEVPGPFVAQWLTNHLPTLLLGTLTPQGQAELVAIQERVLAAFDLPMPAGDTIRRPRFI